MEYMIIQRGIFKHALIDALNLGIHALGGNWMTQMQVDYQKLQETKRHNEEMERQGRAEVEVKKQQVGMKPAEIGASYLGSVGTFARGIATAIPAAVRAAGTIAALFV